MKPVLVSVLAVLFLPGTSQAQSSAEPGAEAPVRSTQAGPATPAPEAPARSTQASPAMPAPEVPAQSTAASSAAPATAAPAADKLAAGTIVSVELSKSLDARKSKANDRIEAKTSMDLLMHGQIVIPRNAKILGHVTEAKAHSKDSPNSTVGIAFDRVLMKNGRELPLQAAVQAIARPLQPVLAFSSDDPMSPASAGIASASQDQRAAMAGVPGQPPASSATLYPPGSAPGSRSENGTPPSSSVSPLGPTSKGVIGMKGLSLNTSGPASVVSSNTENVHLDSGTQLILRVQ